MNRLTLRAALRQLLPAVAAVVLVAGTAVGAGHDDRRCDAPAAERRSDRHRSGQAAQRDRNAARSLQNELSDIEEEVTYLKVKLRKERAVPRSEFTDVRDRLDNLRSRVNGTDTNAGRYGSGSGSELSGRLDPDRRLRRPRPEPFHRAPRSTCGSRRR